MRTAPGTPPLERTPGPGKRTDRVGTGGEAAHGQAGRGAGSERTGGDRLARCGTPRRAPRGSIDRSIVLVRRSVVCASARLEQLEDVLPKDRHGPLHPAVQLHHGHDRPGERQSGRPKLPPREMRPCQDRERSGVGGGILRQVLVDLPSQAQKLRGRKEHNGAESVRRSVLSLRRFFVQSDDCERCGGDLFCRRVTLSVK